MAFALLAVAPASAAPHPGRQLFLQNCAQCHGADATGDEGPDLHKLHHGDEQIHQIITGGIKGEMPAFGKKFGDSEVLALIAYLHSLQK